MVFMARFDGVHAFGYDSAGSQAIWMEIVAALGTQTLAPAGVLPSY